MSCLGKRVDSKRQILVCQYINCQSQGSAAVLKAFQAAVPEGVVVTGCGCQGQCNMGPTVRVLPDETWYCRITPEQVPQIVEQHLINGKLVSDLLHPRWHPRFY